MTRALVVMAKAPTPGLTKTRLIPALGAEGAAELAARLLDHTVQTCLATSAFDFIEICATPDIDHPRFKRLATRYGSRLHWSIQRGKDLGARMSNAFERLLQTNQSVVLIGTDAPALTAQMLDDAMTRWQQEDAVFVPALDGGYALIGLRRPHPGLFEQMPWGTDAVMQITHQRLHAANAQALVLAPVTDIDEPADLEHLPAGWLPCAGPAPLNKTTVGLRRAKHQRHVT
jgi:rSAM/selenodomain-associated transferase 1